MSNWDSLAFNTEGDSCNGVFESFDGQGCEIYKNWLYIRDPKMWCKDRSYVEPTIAEISHGHITISGMEVVAERGPQNAIFVYVEAHKYYTKEDKETEVKRMAGIGCYGYSDPVPALCAHFGINRDDYDQVFSGGTSRGGKNYAVLMCATKDGKPEEYMTEETPELEAQS